MAVDQERLDLYRVEYTQPIGAEAVADVVCALDNRIDPSIRAEMTATLTSKWLQFGEVAEKVPEPGPDGHLVWGLQPILREEMPGEEPDDFYHRSRAEEAVLAMLDEGGYSGRQENHPFATPRRLISFRVWQPGEDLPTATPEQADVFFGAALTHKLATHDALETLRNDPNFSYPYRLPEYSKSEYIREAQFDHLSNLLLTAEAIASLSLYDGRIYAHADKKWSEQHWVNARTYPKAPALAVSTLKTAGELLYEYTQDYGAGFRQGNETTETLGPRHAGIVLTHEFIDTIANVAVDFSKVIDNNQARLDNHYADAWDAKLKKKELERIKAELQVHREAMAGLRYVHADITDRLLRLYGYHAEMIMQQLGEQPGSDRKRRAMQEAWPEAFEELARVRDVVVSLVAPTLLETPEPLTETVEGMCEAINGYCHTDETPASFIIKASNKYRNGWAGRKEDKRNYRNWGKVDMEWD